MDTVCTIYLPQDFDKRYKKYREELLNKHKERSLVTFEEKEERNKIELEIVKRASENIRPILENSIFNKTLREQEVILSRLRGLIEPTLQSLQAIVKNSEINKLSESANKIVKQYKDQIKQIEDMRESHKTHQIEVIPVQKRDNPSDEMLQELREIKKLLSEVPNNKQSEENNSEISIKTKDTEFEFNEENKKLYIKGSKKHSNEIIGTQIKMLKLFLSNKTNYCSKQKMDSNFSGTDAVTATKTRLKRALEPIAIIEPEKDKKDNRKTIGYKIVPKN